MKKVLCWRGLVALGAVLTMVGCGPGAMQEEEGVPTNGSTDEGNPPSASVPDPSSQEPGVLNPNGVQALGANCHVLCSNNKWYGPFKSVNWGSCTEYGKYYCPAHGMAYKACQWW